MNVYIVSLVSVCFWWSISNAAPLVSGKLSTLEMDQNEYLVPHEFSHMKEEMVQAFLGFKSEFNKVYSSLEEELKRFWKFVVNYGKIVQHNRMGNKSFDLKLNRFADMDLEEIRRIMNGLDMPLAFTKNYQKNASYDGNGTKLPQSIDWRSLGAVTPAKDQGYCGSCYAFSAIGAIEAQYFRKHKRLVSLSEQELVSCNPLTNGCHGGLPNMCFEYIKANGIQTEKEYPYIMEVKQCKANSSLIATRISGYVTLPQDEEAIKQTLAVTGPVSVGIDSRCHSFIFYKSGIYNDPCCGSSHINHAVLIVGYGISADNVPYWIVKNSWSSDWGDDGFIYIARGVNQCGISYLPSYPIM